jgi:hypothetical protein
LQGLRRPDDLTLAEGSPPTGEKYSLCTRPVGDRDVASIVVGDRL